jgi:hypothetical protein
MMKNKITLLAEIMKYLLVYFFLLLVGCTNTTLNTSLPPEEIFKERAKTLEQPDMYFQETPESKSVIIGAQVFATLAGCQFMQRYRVTTNSDFTSSLNLLKYRSSMMGASRITIIQHNQMDNYRDALVSNGSEIIVKQGTTLRGSNVYTSLVGDLYDCPCGVNVCSAKIQK